MITPMTSTTGATIVHAYQWVPSARRTRTAKVYL